MGVTRTNHEGTARYISGVPDLIHDPSIQASAYMAHRHLPPTERIRVIDSRLHDQPTLRLEHLLDLFIRRLHILARKVRYLRSEYATVIEWVGGRLVRAHNSIGECNAVIVFAESGRLMYDTCTICIGHVVVCDNSERRIFKLEPQTDQHNFIQELKRWYLPGL